MPPVQAVHRSQIALAAKGNGPAQRAVLRVVQAIEKEGHDLNMELLQAAISGTKRWQTERRSADEGLASPMWIRTRRTRTTLSSTCTLATLPCVRGRREWPQRASGENMNSDSLKMAR